MTTEKQIPKKFTDSFGTNMVYTKGAEKKKVCEGKIIDARFSFRTIMNTKTGDEFYGIELKIKPSDGYNLNRAIWTTPFSSGIPVERNNNQNKD